MYKVSEVIVSVVPVDLNMVDQISKKTGLQAELIAKMLQYNIVSIKQLMLLTKCSQGQVESKIRARWVGTEMVNEFTLCYPFPDGKKGIRFLYRDESLNKFILEKTKEDAKSEG